MPDHDDQFRQIDRLLTIGDIEGAMSLCAEALVEAPEDPELLIRKGRALEGQSRWLDASQVYVSVLRADPDNDAAKRQISAVVNKLSLGDAFSVLEEALRLAPHSLDIWRTILNAKVHLQKYDDVIAFSKNALKYYPDNLLFLERLAEAYAKLGRANDVLEVRLKIVSKYPQDFVSYSNLGVAYNMIDREADAIACFDRAIELNPDKNTLYVNRAVTLLALGNFEDGLQQYERRVQFRRTNERWKDLPIWTCQTDIAGKSIIVHSEFGLGDTIQFCRYIPRLVELGAKVRFAPQPVLRTLMRSLSGKIDLIQPDDDVVADYQCRTMSLPWAFGTRLETIPASVPYLSTAESRIDYFRSRLKPGRLNVGVCWRGSRAGDERGLSFSLEDIARLADIPNVRLLSLQASRDAAEVARIEYCTAIECLNDPSDMTENGFNDTAALAACCDLVISCDTSIAHLAGAMALPTWVLMPVEGDWRWLKGRADSPWYPTMRLFRPSLLGGRAGVFTAVEAELRRLVS